MMVARNPLTGKAYHLLRWAGGLSSKIPESKLTFLGRSRRRFAISYGRVTPPPSASAHAFRLFGHQDKHSGLFSLGGGGGGGSGGKTGGGSGGGSNWSFLSWYMSLLVKYPVMTKAVTSAFLTLVGDLICQLAIDQVPSLDLKRTSIFTSLGLVLVGPTLHFWYLSLSKLVTITGAYGALLRLLLDQIYLFLLRLLLEYFCLH